MERMEHLLRECGYSLRYVGTWRLKECIQMSLEQNGSSQKPAVRICNSIRAATQKAWNNGGKEKMRLLLGYEEEGIPSPSEVIDLFAKVACREENHV